MLHVLDCQVVQCKYHILTTCENNFEKMTGEIPEVRSDKRVFISM